MIITLWLVTWFTAGTLFALLSSYIVNRYMDDEPYTRGGIALGACMGYLTGILFIACVLCGIWETCSRSLKGGSLIAWMNSRAHDDVRKKR